MYNLQKYNSRNDAESKSNEIQLYSKNAGKLQVGFCGIFSLLLRGITKSI